MTTRRAVLLALVLFVAVGRTAQTDEIPTELRTVLEKAEQVELLSLGLGEVVGEGFHGVKVLGRTTVKDAATRRRLVTAFEQGVAARRKGSGLCLPPRHGLRATHEGKTADFIICFECFGVLGLLGDETTAFAITETPQEVFDAVLKAAKVPLAPKADKK